MSRIAVLSDIHGNVPALEAVLADLDAQRVDEVLVGGDLVGRGPQGDAVSRRIRETGWRTIRGNHEDYLLDFRHRRVPADWWQLGEWAASRWMAAELSDDVVAWLDALPAQLTAATAPELRLVHGSPFSVNEGIGPWCSDATLRRHVGAVAEELLVCAHTHRPLDRTLPEGRVVNVGSVGLPFNRDRRAQYAIFDSHSDGDGDGGWRVERRLVPYPLEEMLAIYESTGFLEAGGVTALLLRMELEHAVPFLVPFLEWSRTVRRPPETDAVSGFLDFYDPTEPFSTLYRRLAELEGPASPP